MLDPVDRLRAKASSGDDVDCMTEFRDLLEDDSILDAAVRQLATKPHQEREIMLLHVLGEEFGKRADQERLQEWLSWYKQAPDGPGKTQMTSVLLEIKNKQALDYLVNHVIPEHVGFASGDRSLLYHAVRAVIKADAGLYFQPVIEAALSGSQRSKEILIEGVFEAGGFSYERAIAVLEPGSPLGTDPLVAGAAVFGLGALADERAKTRLLELLREPESPYQEQAFEALRSMNSESPGLFTDAERSEFIDN